MVAEAHKDVEEIALVCYKNAADNLPIATTHVGSTPCINPMQRVGKRDYYPTEFERLKGTCEKDKFVDTLEDPRYT